MEILALLQTAKMSVN